MIRKVRLLEQEVASLKAILHNLPQQNEEEWLDSADVIQRFHFSESKLYRLRKENIIPCIKVGGRYLYPKSYFSDLLLDRIKNKE